MHFRHISAKIQRNISKAVHY